MYHAKREFLVKLDKVQTRFLATVGVTELAALTEFNLAPLSARRDMAMLGVIHWTILGKGPGHFKEHFQPGIGCRLADPRTHIAGNLLARSPLGLVAIYNLLPSGICEASTVKEFQSKLQNLLTLRAKDCCDDWADSFSPRLVLDSYPLRHL